jgi:ActR/RegA family two-component response regulator
MRVQNASTRLVALTGYGHERARSMSAEAGFARHLVKPPDIDTVAAFSRLLRQVRATAELMRGRAASVDGIRTRPAGDRATCGGVPTTVSPKLRNRRRAM